MKKQMQAVSVEVADDGMVILTQQTNDLNDPDPTIHLSAEQTPLVSTWLYEAAGCATTHGDEAASETIPVRYFARGPDAEAEQLDVFCNAQGMVVLKIDDDAFIEISPAMAKRLRKQISVAIRESITDMLRPDLEA
ncbi:hypothetical protein [Cupriavidus sp. IK-TO18]|uniref:hypothetical protein n=1 Tax=Cupriavidus sp. IK-TO18 TaxID=2782182 RepID=UPI00189B5E72|nr:hypothetical protein [Cupriavidus sp. IK-TO18]MBF6989296.1 hypothetical protein [Cupriavidus sp. IK-TO18]